MHLRPKRQAGQSPLAQRAALSGRGAALNDPAKAAAFNKVSLPQGTCDIMDRRQRRTYRLARGRRLLAHVRTKWDHPSEKHVLKTKS